MTALKDSTTQSEGEELVQSYKQTETLVSVNSCLFSLARCFKGTNERMQTIIDACRNLTTKEYLDKIGRLKELKADWVKYWQ